MEHQPDKLAYTPAEFAALFGKSRAWGYRKITEGKVNAITDYGNMMVPASEVERILGSASRYGLTIKEKVKVPDEPKEQDPLVTARQMAWKNHLQGIQETSNEANVGNQDATKTPKSPGLEFIFRCKS